MLASSIAISMGLETRALTQGAVSVNHALIAEVLGEIGVSVGPAPAQFLDEKPAGRLVLLGPGESTLQPQARLNLKLYNGPAETPFGPTSLEVRALLRIARDTIERYLEQTAPAT